MNVSPINNNNKSNQPNFKGYVGKSMKKYISSQMERELADLSAIDKKCGLVTNTPILVDRVKTLHTQVQEKLSSYMKELSPNISMEYEKGVVKLRNKDSLKTLSLVQKDSKKVVTGEIYGDKIDMFSPAYIKESGESTLYYINDFAEIFKQKVLNKSEKINEVLNN